MGIISRIHIKLSLIKQNLFFRKQNLLFAKGFICVPWKKKIILTGTPEYNNVGDSLLTMAILKMYSDLLGGCKIIELTIGEYYRYKKQIKRCTLRHDVFTYQPGGNMGNVWQIEENCRRDVIESFPKNKIILLPQTIHYEENKNGQAELKKSKEIYSAHKNLTVAARERISYELMKKYYPNNKIILTPDAALYLDAYHSEKERNGALLCLRHDSEKHITAEDEKKIEKAAGSKGYTRIDMYSAENPNKQNRDRIVKEKLEEFAGAELVITDRLHGMISCALTETPCVVMSNNNHKVKGVYEWIKDLGYIEYAESADDVAAAVDRVMSVKDRHYSNEKLKPYFKQIIEAIGEVK